MAEISRREQITALMREAGGAHHRAFLRTNGEDPEWPAWYAAYLAEPLGALLGRPLEAEELAADLEAVDREHRDRGRGVDWPSYYADWFLDRAAQPEVDHAHR